MVVDVTTNVIFDKSYKYHIDLCRHWSEVIFTGFLFLERLNLEIQCPLKPSTLGCLYSSKGFSKCYRFTWNYLSTMNGPLPTTFVRAASEATVDHVSFWRYMFWHDISHNLFPPNSKSWYTLGEFNSLIIYYTRDFICFSSVEFFHTNDVCSIFYRNEHRYTLYWRIIWKYSHQLLKVVHLTICKP